MLVIVTVCIFMTGKRCLPESGFVRGRLHTCHERGLSLRVTEFAGECQVRTWQ